MEKKGLLIVISGPSGTGKGTICANVKRTLAGVRDSVSVTTREPRPGEKEGVHYYFRTVEQYQQMIAKGEFLETAEVYRNYYGTPKKPVLKMLAEGYDVLFDIDTLGAKQIKHNYPEAITIFVAPPSLAELERRLRDRGTEAERAVQNRLQSAKRELSFCKNYDYVVVNDDLEVASNTVVGIILAEKSKTARNMQIIEKLLGE